MTSLEHKICLAAQVSYEKQNTRRRHAAKAVLAPATSTAIAEGTLNHGTYLMTILHLAADLASA